jgi:hypothetical protein
LEAEVVGFELLEGLGVDEGLKGGEEGEGESGVYFYLYL